MGEEASVRRRRNKENCDGRSKATNVSSRIAGAAALKVKLNMRVSLRKSASKERNAFFRQRHTTLISFAGMAELADALDSGSSGGNFVEVQVLLPAPKRTGHQSVSCSFLRG